MKKFRQILISICGLSFGVIIGYVLITHLPNLINQSSTTVSPIVLTPKANNPKEVLGFLPYWLLDKAKPNYSGYITTLDYFSLTPDTDGSILKFTAPGQSEPGYYALVGGKLDSFLSAARQNNIKLSLTIFEGNQDKITSLLSKPAINADNLMKDIAPIMQKYSFSDLNLDIERTTLSESEERNNFTVFVKEIRKQMDNEKLGTISIDEEYWNNINSNYMIDTASLEKFVDKFILMGYDYHSTASNIAGPVAPLYGANIIAEFDIQTAIKELLSMVPPSKIILAIPFYGYSWETIDNFERAAVIPTTAVIVSNHDVEDLLASCASCSAQYDNDAQEGYLIYKDTGTQTYHQIFYPNSVSTQSKVDFVKSNDLGGLAIWALGYEGTTNSILSPIKNYLSH